MQPEVVPKVIDAISGSGIPFQEYCKVQIQSAGWNILDIEFPFTHPATEGSQLGQRGTLDIYAYLATNDQQRTICTPVECKQANPDYKAWIFFRHIKHRSLGFVYQLGPNNQQLRWLEPLRSLIPHYDGREVNVINGKILISRDRECIGKASYQVTHAVCGILQETRRSSLGLREYNTSQQFLIPIIATTAELYSCKYDSRDVTADGKLQYDKVQLEILPWLLYEYPLPDFMRASSYHSGEPIENDRKRAILIVNSRYLKMLYEQQLKSLYFDGNVIFP